MYEKPFWVCVICTCLVSMLVRSHCHVIKMQLCYWLILMSRVWNAALLLANTHVTWFQVAGEMRVPEQVSGKVVQYYKEDHNAVSGSTVAERLRCTPEHKFQVCAFHFVDCQTIVDNVSAILSKNQWLNVKRVTLSGDNGRRYFHEILWYTD